MARFHDLRHPAELGARDVRAFLTALAERRKLSASSQTQALSALLFLYRDESVVQRAGRAATIEAKIPMRVTCHSLRHSFATHLLQDGYDIRTVKELLGHRDVAMTMIYTHLLNRVGWEFGVPWTGSSVLAMGVQRVVVGCRVERRR